MNAKECCLIFIPVHELQGGEGKTVSPRIAARWPRPLPLRPAEGLSADFPAHSGSAPSPLRAPRVSPRLPQPRKLFILGSATKKISVHLFWEKTV